MKKSNPKPRLAEQMCGRLAYTRERAVRLLAGIGSAIICSSVIALAQIPETMDVTQSRAAAGQAVELQWYLGAGSAADHFEIRLYASDLTLVATRQISASQKSSVLDPAAFPEAAQVRVCAVAADGKELEQTPLEPLGGRQAAAGTGEAPLSPQLVAGGTNLQMTLDRVNSRLYPYVFVRVTVADTNGMGLTNLTRSDFAVYEDGRLQTNDFNVTPPYVSGGVRAADIVFLIDTSGSMADKIAAVQANATAFANNLAASGIDYRLGLVRFGQTADNGNPSIIGGGLTADVAVFESWVSTLSASGGTEPGFAAIRLAIQGYNFRPGVQTIFLLITDEESDDRDKATTISLIQANGVTVHVAVDCTYGTSSSDYCDSTSVRGVSGGLQFPVQGPYDAILSGIVTNLAATYVVSYRTDNPVFDCTLRNGLVTASHNSVSGSVPFSYVAGGAPIIQRTAATLALHNQPLLQGTTPTISAIISDACPPFVQSATLYVRVSGTSNYTTIAMQLQGTNLYSAVIPAQFVVTPGLDYYIRATDGQVASTDPASEPEANPYQLAVLPNQAPVITHVPPASAMLGTDLSLPVQIEDSTMGLSEIGFYYRLRGQLLWNIVKITNSLPLPTLVVTNFVIPGAQVQLPAVQYYFRAVDNFGVSSTGPAGGADNPYEVPVVSNRSPVAKCKGIVIVGTGPGVCSADVLPGAVDDGSFDPDGDPITLSIATLGTNQVPLPAGTNQLTLPLGTNVVMLTVCDNHSACASCEALIVVVDTTPPMILCASNKFVECGAAWDFDPPFAFDNCSASNVFISVVSTVTNAGCGGTFTATRTWAAVDSATNTATCSQTVIVVDTTPPTIVCPAPITVEFQDENGAVVPCAVTASDTCSSVSLTVTPPCGSLFPIGVTPVQALAVDACGNSNQCAFTVTVLGALGVKSNVLVELIVLNGQANQQQNGNDVLWWQDAITNMMTSLQTNRWVDQTHVVCGKPGSCVFSSESATVGDLVNLINWNGSGIPAPTLQDLVDRLVRADRLLAVVAIREAVLAGVSSVVISNALWDVAQGDQAAVGGQQSGGPDPASAIMWYKKAWALTCRICRPVVTPLNGCKWMQIQFMGVPGQKYLIPASDDMVNWTSITTVTMGSSGIATYTDKNAYKHPHQFYRIVAAP